MKTFFLTPSVVTDRPMPTSHDGHNPSSSDVSIDADPSTSDASNRLPTVEEGLILDLNTLTETHSSALPCSSMNIDQITTTTPSPTRSLSTDYELPSLLHETLDSVYESEPRENLKTPENVNPTEANLPSSLHNLNQASSSSATLEEIRPFPKAAPLLENRRNSRKRKSAIYTDTPEKLKLLDMKNKREDLKKKKTETKNRIGKGMSKGKGKGKGKAKAKEKGTDKVNEIADDTVDENDGNVDSDDESTICLECTESYADSVPGEQWIQCITCKLWVHAKCVRGNLLFFECKHCISDIED